MNTFRFLDFPVYLLAKEFYAEIFSITKTFPRDYWSICDQIRRSSLSVCLNIAEGSAKRSDKDFNRFIENALGSINETVAALDICYQQQLINKVKFEQLVVNAERITKQLGGLSKKLRTG